MVAGSRALEQLGEMLSPVPAAHVDTGNEAALPQPASTVVAHLPLNLIVAPPRDRQVRDVDATDEDLDTLVESLRQHGLLHPVGVRSLDNGRFELVYGGRRLSAARRLGWQTIAASLHMQMDEEPALVAALAENLHRRDLGPRERVAALRLLATVHRPGKALGGRSSTGHQGIVPPERQPGSAGDLARKLGVDVSTVTRLAALGRDEELLELVETGEMGLTAASHVARVPPPLRQGVLEDVRSQRLSANGTHRLVNDVLRRRGPPAAPQPVTVAERPPASGVVHRLRTVLGQLCAIDHVSTTLECQLLGDIADQVARLRVAEQAVLAALR